MSMAKTVKVPTPVYDRIARESERDDVPKGIVVRDWMEKADKFEEMGGGIR